MSVCDGDVAIINEESEGDSNTENKHIQNCDIQFHSCVEVERVVVNSSQ